MPRADPGARRGLLVAVLLLVAAAAALAGAAVAVWMRPSFDTAFRGQVTIAVTGGEWEPALIPLALLALAGVAGAVATGGWARRLVGALLAAAGVWAAMLGVWPQFGVDPRAAREAVAEVPTGGRLSGAPGVEPWTLLAALGGLLLVGGGLLLVARAGTMPRLGARYSSPGATRREPEPERRLWEALDTGEDPT